MTSTTASRPFTVGVDLDCTTLDYHGGIDAHLHKIGHASAGRGAPRNYSYVEAGYFENVAEYLAIHTAAMLDGMFATLVPFPGALDTLHSLADKGVRLVAVTHRVFTGHDEVEKSTTLDWVRSSEAPFADVVFTGEKHLVDVDLWIDDAPAIISQLTSRDLPVIIYDRPHNRGIPGVRVTGWGSEIESLVLTARDQAGF